MSHPIYEHNRPGRGGIRCEWLMLDCRPWIVGCQRIAAPLRLRFARRLVLSVGRAEAPCDRNHPTERGVVE
jgi:hypothetical protein